MISSIYFFSNPKLDPISCTDLTQKWGKTGKTFAQQFSAVCAADMCHTRKKVSMKDDIVSEEKQLEYRL